MSATTDVQPGGHHRHTRSAAKPSSNPASSQHHPQNPHHLNMFVHAQSAQSDVRMMPLIQSSDPTTPPRTPRRENHSVISSNTPETGSKQRSRNKTRPKNVTTSPAIPKKDRSTPPLSNSQTTVKPMNTPLTTAYAGPTFHASPAPSALPIPSFYSKSVPDSPGGKVLQSSPKESAVTTQTSSTPTKSQFQREESPLDFFFKADREEKARARSASSTQQVSIPGPFQPPASSPRHSQTPPFSEGQRRSRPGHTARMPSSGMFAMEIDGDSDPGTPYGPAFSTPYAQRINAAKSAKPVSSSLPQPSDLQHSTDRSEALKAYLFSGHNSSPTVTGQNGASGSSGRAPLQASSITQNHSTPSTLAGSRSSGHVPSRSYFSQIYGPDSRPSAGVSRLASRSSGLRQEVTPTKPHSLPFVPIENITASPSISEASRQLSSPVNSSNNHLLSKNISPSALPSINHSHATKSADLQGMEDSLRKILKLDSSGVSGVTGIGQLPAASASVPSYVGARAPPMNGMHNGVMGS